jgi:EAL domain-containing protein (putative c-di-GMP-specific phosphodiesterase class I)
MAAKLGITSLAEGVETEGEYRWCVENGADLMQGYLFGRPSEVPAVTVECPAV